MARMKHTSMEILIGDDESQAEKEVLIALPCPLMRLYLGRHFSHTRPRLWSS